MSLGLKLCIVYFRTLKILLKIFIGFWESWSSCLIASTFSRFSSCTLQSIVLITVSVGALFSVLFHVGVKESPSQHYTTLGGGEARQMRAMDWFRLPPLYQVAALYMLARLFANVTQVYIPLYLQDSLELKEESIAVIPLVMFITGFLSSFGMKKLNQLAGRKVGLFFFTPSLSLSFWFVLLCCTFVWEVLLLTLAGILKKMYLNAF